MFRTSPVALATFAAALAILQPAAALAQESDLEAWVELSAQGQIAPGAQLKVEVEERFREGADEAILGATVDFAVNERVDLGGGVEIHEIAGYTEVRPFQQVTLGVGDLSFRTRIEERFFDNADQISLRLRQRVQYSPTIAPGTRARLSAELLYQLTDRVEAGPRRIDQWRLGAGIQHRIAPQLDLTGGYLLVIRPRPAGQTRHAHVPQLAIGYRF